MWKSLEGPPIPSVVLCISSQVAAFTNIEAYRYIKADQMTHFIAFRNCHTYRVLNTIFCELFFTSKTILLNLYNVFVNALYTSSQVSFFFSLEYKSVFNHAKELVEIIFKN